MPTTLVVLLCLLAPLHAQQQRHSPLARTHRRRNTATTCSSTSPDCGPGMQCNCGSGRRLFGAPTASSTTCTCNPMLSPPPPPAPLFYIDMNGDSQLGSGSTYQAAFVGTTPSSISGCVGATTDHAVFRYDFTLPSAGAYDVVITWGTSTYADRTYVSWDTAPTSATSTSNYIVGATTSSGCTASACDADEGSTITYTSPSMTAGTHSLFIGSTPDGNYYAVPWCRVQVRPSTGP